MPLVSLSREQVVMMRDLAWKMFLEEGDDEKFEAYYELYRDLDTELDIIDDDAHNAELQAIKEKFQ